MRITIQRDGKRRLVLEGEQIGLKAPGGEYPLEVLAEFEEGSPIAILINGAAPMPVRQLKVVNRTTYHVKTFRRITRAGIQQVAAHDRRKPYFGKREG